MLIMVISVRLNQWCQQYLDFLPGMVMVGSSVRRWLSLIAKTFKEQRERSERLMYEQVTAIISALVICIIVCLSWAVNHCRDNAITYKARRDKNVRELKLANAAITDMQMRQRDVAALDAKYTKELTDAKAENDALALMMLPLVVVSLHIKQSVSQCVKPPPPAWIMQPPPDWQTPLNGIDHLPSEG